MSIMSLQDELWRRTNLLSLYNVILFVLLSTPVFALYPHKFITIFFLFQWVSKYSSQFNYFALIIKFGPRVRTNIGTRRNKMTSFGADTGTRIVPGTMIGTRMVHGTMIGTKMVSWMRTETRFGTATGGPGVQTGILWKIKEIKIKSMPKWMINEEFWAFHHFQINLKMSYNSHISFFCWNIHCRFIGMEPH